MGSRPAQFRLPLWGISAVLLLILAGSIWLNLNYNHFALGLHVDEVKKVLFIDSGQRDFKHPQLILKLAGLFASVRSAEGLKSIVMAGRLSTALLGTALCGITFLLARSFLAAPAALLAAAIAAVSPGIVIHSHFLKEDIAMACFATAALVVALQLITRLRAGTIDGGPWRWLTLLWGLSLGLAIASKYTAIVVIPIFAVLPFLVREIPKAPYLRRLVWACAGGAVVFLGVNHELLVEPRTFSSGVEFELDHALKGHSGIRLFPWHTFFTFHLRRSILPSLGWLPTLFALLGMVLTALPGRPVPWPARILLLYTALFYGVLEMLPLKPHPGYVRYVVPLLPPLACFAAFSVQTLIRRCRPRPAVALFALLALLLLIPPLARSLTLSYWLEHDSRTRASELLEGSRPPIAIERHYTGLSWMDRDLKSHMQTVDSILDVDLDNSARAFCTLVTSSFTYQRYFEGARHRGQQASVYTRQRAFAELFSRGRRDLNPGEPTFSFVNPTLTAVDLCGPPDQRQDRDGASEPS